MSKPLIEVADVFRAHAQVFLAKALVTPARRRVIRDVIACRSAELGGHSEECMDCGHKRVSYNSCRNRHCPKCQGRARAEWLQAREKQLLPVDYYHVVFTIPSEVADLALQNKKALYALLFSASANAMKTIAADPKRLGAEIGFLSVLHTWGQQLLHHPHVHCVVPGGGISRDGKRWVSCSPGFFLPVRVLGSLFRRLFLEGLEGAYSRGELQLQGRLERLAQPRVFKRYISDCRSKNWVVYCKAPFGGPEQVLKYLARYTHRVAISNHRIVKLERGKVSFLYKDYRHGNRPKTMTLQATEFIRRFLLHVLPRGFTRIRHYGFLANRSKQFAKCRALLGADREVRHEDENAAVTTISEGPRCPSCGSGSVILHEVHPKSNPASKIEILDSS